ncbi:ATP-binding protein [Caldimonas brevitalea]|uniref:histidine kinase n=1 Tax=Caldimonas brevitalea TaxID=413882 RepID=A0A0G3BL38_9BURK|nr:ATP-binding protein [Caldimonas brevitalea]AKJ28698.1 sensory box histidine kinase/response regulator [Caldimonas brevitalea]
MQQVLIRIAAVAVTYGVLGAATVLLSLRFAIPSPIFPATGVAMGAVLVWGLKVLPGVFAGRLLLTAITGGTFGPAEYSLAFEAAVAAGATLQAAAGGWLARRIMRPTEYLDSGGRVVAFLALIGPASCWIAPAIGVPALVWHGRIAADDVWFVFYKWWVGDSIGAMWVAPIFLPLFGRFRSLWRSRAPTVVGTLLSMSLLLGASLAVVTNQEKQRLSRKFEKEVTERADAIKTALGRVVAVAEGVRRWSERTSPEALPEAVSAFALPQLPAGATVRLDHSVAAPVPHGDHRAAVDLSPSHFMLRLPGDPPIHVEVPALQVIGNPASWSPVRLCLFDAQVAPPKPIWGADGCREVGRRSLQRETEIDFAGRRLLLRAIAPPAYVARDRSPGMFTADLLAMAGSIFVIAFVLVMTGRTQRVKELVNERTAELSEREERLRFILRSAGVGIVYASPGGLVEQVNDEASRMIGLSESQALRRHLTELVQPDQVDALRARMLAALKSELPPAVQEVTLVRPDAPPLEVLATLAVSRSSGRSQHIVCILHDLTDVRRLQSAELAQSLAEQESHAKGEFVSRMSHELRTPLNAILGFAQLIRGRPQDPVAVRNEKLARIEQAGWHLLAMIEDILLLGRLEAGTEAVVASTVDVHAVIEDGLALLEPEARARGIDIVWQREHARPYVRGDMTRVQQVLLNFLTNAIKYNRPSGQVRVSVIEGEDQWGIGVSDTGMGMSPEQVRQLFIPFNRLGQERKGTSGTGIGLVISRRLAEQMHGSVEVKSQEGVGSTFTLWLPKSRMPAAVVPEETVPGPEDRELCGRVMYVEDNEVNVEVMRAVFAHDKDVRLVTCGTGQEAVESLEREDIDLVLLDLGLPDMSGEEALQRLRDCSTQPCPPIVVVSADAEESTRAWACSQGAADCIPKPFDVAQLRQTVAKVLEAR